jgi:hypothetical protein
MKRPMRCWSCRTTQEFIWIGRFQRMLCGKCREKKIEAANVETMAKREPETNGNRLTKHEEPRTTSW